MCINIVGGIRQHLETFSFIGILTHIQRSQSTKLMKRLDTCVFTLKDMMAEKWSNMFHFRHSRKNRILFECIIFRNAQDGHLPMTAIPQSNS